MTRLLLVPLTAALLVACESPAGTVSPDTNARPDASATSSTSSTIAPLDQIVFVPCANGGSGELVELTGNLHTLSHLTISSSGNFTVKDHFQPQNVSGTGLTTGATYHGTGVTQDQSRSGQVGFEETFINNFRIIGQGPGNNSLVHENLHVTVNANGTVTASINNFGVDCR